MRDVRVYAHASGVHVEDAEVMRPLHWYSNF